MKKTYLVVLFALALSIAGAASSEASHPLRHIHPIDTGLNMSNQKVFNVSSLELNDGTLSGTGLVFDDYTIRDSGNNYRLKLDTGSSLWKFVGSAGDTARFHSGGNVGIPSGNLLMNGNEIKMNTSQAHPWGIRTNAGANFIIRRLGTGGGEIVFDNSSNTLKIGGNNNGADVEIPNGYLNVTGGDLEVSGQLSAGSTECGSSEALLGDGTCGSTGGSQNLSETLSNGNSAGSNDIDMNNNTIKNVSVKHFRLPVGTDAW